MALALVVLISCQQTAGKKEGDQLYWCRFYRCRQIWICVSNLFNVNANRSVGFPIGNSKTKFNSISKMNLNRLLPYDEINN